MGSKNVSKGEGKQVSDVLTATMEKVKAASERARQREESKPSERPVDWSTGENISWVRSMLARSNVPIQYREAVLEKCRVQDDLAHWMETAETLIRRGRGELIFGPVGTGKSSTAALIAAEAVKVRASVEWRYVPDLCDQLLANSRQRAEVVRNITAPDVVVFDDFGVRPFSDFEVGILDQIFENRYRRRRSVVLTTNIPREKITDDPRLQRMVDRWRQTCGGITINGKSMRATT